MKKVLSIDFDYFIDTDVRTRNLVFPNGIDKKDIKEMTRDWDKIYTNTPQIKEIGVITDYYEVCQRLIYMETCKVVSCDSHNGIDRVFNMSWDKEFIIDHIDFHHDFYLGANPNKLDCSNWLRIILEKYPKSKVNWIRREDSETTSILGEYPFESTTKLNLMDEYDYVFICMSPEWTPPHLRAYYNFMVSCAHLGID